MLQMETDECGWLFRMNFVATSRIGRSDASVNLSDVTLFLMEPRDELCPDLQDNRFGDRWKG